MASLEGNVRIPLVGTVPKKAAAGGVGVVGVLVVVYYVRKRKAASAAPGAAATATDQYPPDGTTGNPQDPYSTDPATGQTYGDEAAGSGGTFGAFGGAGGVDTGTYPWDGTTGNEADPYSLDPATGVTFGDEGLATGGTNANPSGGPPFASNSAWENWAIEQLQVNDPAINLGDLTTALGLYLNGQPVSAAEKTLVFDARGVAGDPPVAGANNYPPNVRTDGGTGGHDATIVTPDVVGVDVEQATQILTAAGLKAKGPAGAKGVVHVVTAQSPKAGTKVRPGTVVTLTTKIVTENKLVVSSKPPIITPGRR